MKVAKVSSEGVEVAGRKGEEDMEEEKVRNNGRAKSNERERNANTESRRRPLWCGMARPAYLDPQVQASSRLSGPQRYHP